LQHRITRTRRPRVQITYDVHLENGMKKVELPFVVGVLADLSGQRKEPLPPVMQRSFTFIDRDNFNSVLARQAPRLALRVANKLGGDPNSMINAELNFQSMDDFGPTRVAEQIEPLRQLLEARLRLTELEARLEGNDKLEQLLGEVLTDMEKAKGVAGQLGIDTAAEKKEG
jgi:type VI secretion system protein ImpB